MATACYCASSRSRGARCNPAGGAVPGAVPSRASGADPQRVGRVGEQPQGKVLPIERDAVGGVGSARKRRAGTGFAQAIATALQATTQETVVMRELLARLHSAWRGIARGSRLDVDMDEEMGVFHVEMQAERLMRERGLDPTRSAPPGVCRLRRRRAVQGRRPRHPRRAVDSLRLARRAARHADAREIPAADARLLVRDGGRHRHRRNRLPRSSAKSSEPGDCPRRGRPGGRAAICDEHLRAARTARALATSSSGATGCARSSS